MQGLPDHLPNGWGVTGLEGARWDGINTYYQQHPWQLDGKIGQRTLLQIQMQYYNPSHPVSVSVQLNGRLIDTLTFAPAMYHTQTFAVFVNPGAYTIGIIPEADALTRLYFPAMQLSFVQLGRSEKEWGGVRWNLNGDLGATGQSVLQVDDGLPIAYLNDQAWTIPIQGGKPANLYYQSVGFITPYQVEWTALGASDKKLSVIVPQKTATLPKHKAEESVELPAWTTSLQVRAICANAKNDCYPIQLSQAYVLGVSFSQPSQRERTLVLALYIFLLVLLVIFLFRRRL